ncbi:uncharacterized protein METZ01_LOCUS257441, partial [marine metagenome]
LEPRQMEGVVEKFHTDPIRIIRVKNKSNQRRLHVC